jgi:hypothetical protein
MTNVSTSEKKIRELSKYILLFYIRNWLSQNTALSIIQHCQCGWGTKATFHTLRPQSIAGRQNNWITSLQLCYRSVQQYSLLACYCKLVKPVHIRQTQQYHRVRLCRLHISS